MLTHYRNDVEDNDRSRSPDPLDIIVGGNVRRLRAARGLSQERLGEKLGLTFQQVQKYEKGANRISSSRLVKIARALEVHPARLFEGTGLYEEQPIADAFASVLTAEDVKIVHAYKAISSPKQKAALLSMARTMAQAED